MTTATARDMSAPFVDLLPGMAEDEAASLLTAWDGPALLLDQDHTVGLVTTEAARLLALASDSPRVGAPLASMLACSRLPPEARDRLMHLAQPTTPPSCRLHDAANGGMAAQRVALPRRRMALLLRPDPLLNAAAPPPRTDPLTGLLDRAGFRAAVTSGLAARDWPFGLVVLDIDRFRIINDTLGPQVGDQLLTTLAARLRSALRGSDLPARLAGDEFAVLAGETAGQTELEGLARRLMDRLSRPYLLAGQPVTVGLSAGIARAPENGADADTLLRCATMALHAAKAAGTGRCAAFTPEMQARSESRRRLETDLRRAFALRQFDLHYQPQVNVTTNRLFGFEALLRWRHPTNGPVSPGEFIPIAEEIGLIAPIGAWVLATACKEAAGWPRDLTVGVNVSALQFEQGDLLEAVHDALTRSGLPPHRLEIEVTESALLGNPEATLAVLRQLRGSGVRIAMDDFGTGYSSLTRLQSFPFDKIKIDRSFVSGQRGIAEGRAIVRAIASLGASLGMRTIAEGVETTEQLERVRAEGCTEVQGYYFGRPMPPADLPDVIARFAVPASRMPGG
ncbi:MAG: bifunctional diguanylate cyclase/phosphodiesterase [Rhodospirillales bacterium]|nr:bifunctional diguanylate cyclase/phosphodiesterase [Rhodospirillales bacterium]